jgi:hypothetical protein
MYLKKPGSTKRRIKDLYDVWIPPVPPRSEILFSDLKKDDQYWRRTPLPNFYEERRPEELEKQEREKDEVDQGIRRHVTHFDPKLERYRRQEWNRRIYGVWFMNHGVPTYLTGAHYFYLQWCKFDHEPNNGYPLFYIPQLDRFYFRQLCLEDPFCLGYLMVGPRGGGKTTEEVACQIENITKPGHQRFAAIQSKSDSDAKEVIFQEKMVPLFNSLPDFFKPEFSHGTDPKEQMVFKRKAVTSKNAKKIKHGNDYELGSTISCYPPNNKALDGKTLADVINDEIGKLKPEKEVDAYERNQTNTRTVFRNRRKTGIIRATTTIEHMDMGGDECHEVWLESDPNKRDANGYTVSKLYKYFISAIDVQVDLADKYGFIPYDEAYKQIMNEREPVKDDNAKLSSLMRKNPTTEEEAFIQDQSQCIYDVMILNKRLSDLKMIKADKKFRKYHAEWKNGVVDGEVELIENANGDITIFYMPDEFWSKDRKLLNACHYYMDDRDPKKKIWMPVNNDFFRASTDPIRYIKTSDPRASKMAGHGMMLFIPDLDNGKDPNDFISKNIMWEYCARHTDPEEDYENIIKLMRFFGHSIMPEANAGEFIKHLISRGYQNFIIMRKNFSRDVLLTKNTKNAMSGENAVHSNTETIESYVKRTAAYIRRHGHRLNSIPLIEQLIKFDPKDPTKYDLAVSFGYGILAMEARLDDDHDRQKESEMLNSYFQRYDISGNQSKALAMASNDDEAGDFDNPEFVNAILNGR